MLFLARRGAGLSQRALAERAGVPQSTVARIERGRIDPRASTLNALLRACGLELTVQRLSVDANGIDRTLIRSQFDRTPTERVQSMVVAAELAHRVAEARTARAG